MKPPTLHLTRDGVSNFAEIEAWAEANVPLWHSANTVRRVHGLSRTEWLEFLAASLVLENEGLRFIPTAAPPAAVLPDTGIGFTDGGSPADTLAVPPDEPVIRLHPDPADSRFGVAVLIGLAFFLLIAACVIGFVLHEHPAFWGTCAAASGACFWRAYVAKP